MTSKQVKVTNKIGFHARPASLLIQAAKKYSSIISLEKGGQRTDLDSIVGLMKLRVKCGDAVTIFADGPDENEAVEELINLVESKFGEE